MGAKTRGNYPTGGWCGRRDRCLNDGVSCDYCIRFSEFEDFDEAVEEVDNAIKIVS